jgi:eukaryotic-like serine/threonine-protein kinase
MLVSLAGQTVGAYTLESQIGQGGMGRVWLASRNDGRFERRVAVKFLHANFVGRAAEERLRREGSILARLSHPHIARLLDAGVSPAGQPYLVLEWIEGQSIDRHCDAQKLGIRARLRLFVEVLSAVAHAHANLIVHRDIKPSNVLLDAGGAARLTDFGLAKGRDYSVLTMPGQMLGTMDYLAPELIRGDEPSAASDVYAFGCLVYACVAGRPPFAGRGLFGVGAGHLDEEPPDPCARRADVPDGFGEAIGFALRKAPGDRPSTATAYARLIAVGARGGSG